MSQPVILKLHFVHDMREVFRCRRCSPYRVRLRVWQKAGCGAVCLISFVGANPLPLEVLDKALNYVNRALLGYPTRAPKFLLWESKADDCLPRSSFGEAIYERFGQRHRSILAYRGSAERPWKLLEALVGEKVPR